MEPKTVDIDIFLQRYKDLAIQHGSASRLGDYRKANKAYENLKKLYSKLQENETLTEKVLPILLKSDDIRVQIWAAAHCLGLSKFIEEADKTLVEISKMKDAGIERTSAEMTLKVWREKGPLKF